jgi:hypothetical protein
MSKHISITPLPNNQPQIDGFPDDEYPKVVFDDRVIGWPQPLAQEGALLIDENHSVAVQAEVFYRLGEKIVTVIPHDADEYREYSIELATRYSGNEQELKRSVLAALLRERVLRRVRHTL